MEMEWLFTPHYFLISRESNGIGFHTSKSPDESGESFSSGIQSYNADPIGIYFNWFGLGMPRFYLFLGNKKKESTFELPVSVWELNGFCHP